jgi:hypothetical protein
MRLPSAHSDESLRAAPRAIALRRGVPLPVSLTR